jgi:hypothetical protein
MSTLMRKLMNEQSLFSDLLVLCSHVRELPEERTYIYIIIKKVYICIFKCLQQLGGKLQRSAVTLHLLSTR